MGNRTEDGAGPQMRMRPSAICNDPHSVGGRELADRRPTGPNGLRKRRSYNLAVSPSEVARAANRARFARLIARPDADVDLALGALCIAADARPDLEFGPTLQRLEALTDRVRLRLDRGDGPEVTLARLHGVLYVEAGLRGPRAAEYHDIRNSHIDAVLERGIGLPITLAVVELEVGWRLGVRLQGVGLPGHFIIRAPNGTLVDPAGGGRSLTPDDCQALLRESVGDRILFHPSLLRAAGKREILARILRNIRSLHLSRRDWPAALGAVELLSVVEPTESDHGRDRALLLGRMGRFTEAIGGLSHYLDERPDAPDEDDVRQVMAIFRGRRN
jgi:regulator of sirC expression with transglutaminase-like and TPR domain